MKNKIFGILKHSAFYSIGNIALKGMGVITLPIYTRFLTQSEYGMFGLLDITITILAEILTLGQANSLIYFNNKSGYDEKKRSIFFTITALILIANFIFILLAEAFGFSILTFAGSENTFGGYLPFLIYIVFLRAVNTVFVNKLRAEEKSLFFTSITLIKIVVFVGLIFLTVVHFKQSVYGIMNSYLLSEVVVLMILIPNMIKEMDWKWDKDIAKQALKFGFPLIFSSIGIMILNVSDRYLIGYFVDLTSVGLYDFGYRIAGVLNMFLIMPFGQALLPSAIKEFGKEGDKRYYSKLMTYMCFVTIWGGFAISIFSDEFIRIFGTENYSPAKFFIPLIIIAYIFSAKRNVASTGLFLSGKTSYIALITLAAGILNIVLNIIFIPIYGFIAAAYTTVISFIIFYFLTKILADRFYKIAFETKKITILFLVAILLFVLHEAIPVVNYPISLFLKLILIAVFPFILYPFKFYEKIELETLKNGLTVFKNPREFMSRIKELLNK